MKSRSTPQKFLSKMKKPTQIDVVADKLKQDGEITNVWAFEHFILRLSNKIRALEALGWKFDKEKSGYIEGTKNWRYVLLERPFKKVFRTLPASVNARGDVVSWKKIEVMEMV